MHIKNYLQKNIYKKKYKISLLNAIEKQSKKMSDIIKERTI